MLTYLILAGIVISGFAFVMWLGTFILNRGVNTTLETDSESRRSMAGQLFYGLVLFGVTAGLTFVFFQMDREPVIPPMPDGMQAKGALPQAPPPGDSGMNATLAFGGTFLFGFFFVVWLGLYMLNKSVNISMQSARESRRGETGQLVAGTVLLGLTIACSVALFTMDRTALVPDIPTYPKTANSANQQETMPAKKSAPAPAPTAPNSEEPSKVEDEATR